MPLWGSLITWHKNELTLKMWRIFAMRLRIWRWIVFSEDGGQACWIGSKKFWRKRRRSWRNLSQKIWKCWCQRMKSKSSWWVQEKLTQNFPEENNDLKMRSLIKNSIGNKWDLKEISEITPIKVLMNHINAKYLRSPSLLNDSLKPIREPKDPGPRRFPFPTYNCV